MTAENSFYDAIVALFFSTLAFIAGAACGFFVGVIITCALPGDGFIGVFTGPATALLCGGAAAWLVYRKFTSGE